MIDNFNKEENGIISAVLTQWGNFCNICGSKRSIDNVKIIKRNLDNIVVHINCTSCNSGSFISFNYSNSGFTMQQYSSDLNTSELYKLGNAPVSIHDLIDTHIALDKVH